MAESQQFTPQFGQPGPDIVNAQYFQQPVSIQSPNSPLQPSLSFNTDAAPPSRPPRENPISHQRTRSRKYSYVAPPQYVQTPGGLGDSAGMVPHSDAQYGVPNKYSAAPGPVSSGYASGNPYEQSVDTQTPSLVAPNLGGFAFPGQPQSSGPRRPSAVDHSHLGVSPVAGSSLQGGLGPRKYSAGPSNLGMMIPASPDQEQTPAMPSIAQYQSDGIHPGQTDDGGLSAQMNNMSINETATMRKKKKDRHAYHKLDTSVGGLSAIPPQLENQHGGAGRGFLSPGVNSPIGISPIAPSYLADASMFTSSEVGSPMGGSTSPVVPRFPTFMKTPINPAAIAQNPNGSAGQNIANGGATWGVQTSAQGRVDPEEVPSIPRARDSSSVYYLKNMYPTFEYHIPPPGSVAFAAFDQGNSSPKFTRLTMNCIPATSDSLDSTGLPLGLLLQPLAPLQLGELEIPLLDFGDAGPPRCIRCRAYINPFMVFNDGGNKFVCNMCGHANDVPLPYFCPLSNTGARLDRESRPELMRGTVEFIVPKEYYSKEPVGMRIVFLIDVSQEAFNKGFLAAFCEGVVRALYGEDQLPLDEDSVVRHVPQGSHVGFVTFDKDIHFYNMSPALEQAQMLVMPDIEEPFLPLSDGLFVDPYNAKSNIVSFLNKLPSMFSQVKNPEPALLPSLNSALVALEKTGGKIICSLAALPTWGPGRLFIRDDGKQIGDAEKKLLTTEHPGWKKIADKMVTEGVGADFFLAAPGGGYLDIATIGHVSGTTGGETYYYPNFLSPRDNEKLIDEVIHTVRRETGYQALLKVRCSNGLQVASYHGNFLQRNFGSEVEFGTIDCDKAVAILFKHDGKLDSKLDAHFQSALLYTTAGGQRRVRCSNVIAGVTGNAKDCVQFVDQDSVTAMIAKEAATKMATHSLKEIRGALSEKNVDILSEYRKKFSGSHPPGQLVLPENLKEFSMFILSLIKCRAFKDGQVPTDRRVHEMRMIKNMGAMELSLYLYPRMIPVHNLAPEDCFLDPETGHLRMPPSVRCSFAVVEPGGVYLVDNGQNCYLWLHAQTSPNLLMDLFGDDKTSLGSLDPYASKLPVLESHLNAQVRNVLEYLKTIRGSKAVTIQLARQGLDGAEYEFARCLVEDRNNEAQSYVDWLVHIHRYVQLEITGQRKKGGDGDGEKSSLASNFAGLRTPHW